LLRRKHELIFSQGNADARKRLFGHEGAFSRFSAKIDSAFCAGWIDVDLHHDLHILRKVRNEFAHQMHGLSLESPKVAGLVDQLRVPHRDFYDWGLVKAAATRDGQGVTLFTGQTPQEAGEPLKVPAGFIFRAAASRVIAHLCEHLKVGVLVSKE
jgi:hypothetical protein